MQIDWKNEFKQCLQMHTGKSRAVEDFIKSLILSKVYNVGDKLPNDQFLTEKLGLARLTVQRGLNSLAKQGLLSRQRGSGTYVMDNRQNSKGKVPSGSIKTVGLLFPFFKGSSSVEIFNAYLNRQGKKLLFFNSIEKEGNNVEFENALALEQLHLKTLAEQGTDLIFCAPIPRREKPRAKPFIIEKGIRLVYLWPHWPNMTDYEYALPDYKQMTGRAIFELSKNGAKRIITVRYPGQFNYAAQWMEEGAATFCRSAGLSLKCMGLDEFTRAPENEIDESCGIIFFQIVEGYIVDLIKAKPVLAGLDPKKRIFVISEKEPEIYAQPKIYLSFSELLKKGLEAAEKTPPSAPLQVQVSGKLLE